MARNRGWSQVDYVAGIDEAAAGRGFVPTPTWTDGSRQLAIGDQ
jgi:hypothetical protein